MVVRCWTTLCCCRKPGAMHKTRQDQKIVEKFLFFQLYFVRLPRAIKSSWCLSFLINRWKLAETRKSVVFLRKSLFFFERPLTKKTFLLLILLPSAISPRLSLSDEVNRLPLRKDMQQIRKRDDTRAADPDIGVLCSIDVLICDPPFPPCRVKHIKAISTA